MNAIYNFVQKNVKWDDKYGIGAKNNFRKTLEAKKGSVGEINLMLTALLREVGLEAFPVLLSTRKHGRIKPNVPLVYSFNYVVVLVRIGEKKYLLDGTHPNLPVGILPFHCLNGEGLIIEEGKVDWIDLHLAQGKKSQIHTVIIKPDEVGALTGEISANYQDYKADDVRKQIVTQTEEKYWENTWQSDNTAFKVNERKIENLKEAEKPLKLNLKIALENQLSGGMIYFDPFLVKTYPENLFKQEKREYTVDFGCPNLVILNKNWFATLANGIWALRGSPTRFYIGRYVQKTPRVLP
jgi:hypothetical protein